MPDFENLLGRFGSSHFRNFHIVSSQTYENQLH